MHRLLKYCQHVHKLINIYGEKKDLSNTKVLDKQCVDKVIKNEISTKNHKKVQKKRKNISYTQLYQQNVNNFH